MPAHCRAGCTFCATSFAVVLLIVCRVEPAAAQTAAQLKAARERLVRTAIVGEGIKNPRVIQAMRTTPRHQFLPRRLWPQAYFDMGLPIGASQTISGPFIVAFMTEAIDPQPTDKVLEIGTGSGYQAAVLSPLVKHVYTIEIVESLGRKAKRDLRRLGYDNVTVKIGDGFKGWPEHAPFDKIIVTCSPEKVPQPLADQLAEGGLMVIPTGRRYSQTLYLMRKKDGKLQREALRPTLFVPMTGRAEDTRKVPPDPANPQVLNGSFEKADPEGPHFPGWYYCRQQHWEKDPSTPDGDYCLTLKNRDEGRDARAVQGFGIDGRKIDSLQVIASVKYRNVVHGPQRTNLPMITLTFYDENRSSLGTSWLGPWRGTANWSEVRRTFRVPADAREGNIRVGMFGAVGEISFDNLRFKTRPR